MGRNDEWLQADTRTTVNSSQEECRSTKQQETRCWGRTVCVPEGMQPVDIINACQFESPLLSVHAGQMGINQHDVECIASAMADPNLRWQNMCNFMVAPCEGMALPNRILEKNNLVLADYVGDQVLLTGHHRFLALLLCGVPLSELPPIQIRTAPMGVPYVFPWSIVEWGA